METVTRRPENYRHGLSAPSMAAAVALDPQLAVPVRPRLIEHLVIVELADGIVFEGAGDRQVLRGRAATGFLPALLPLLDGRRRVAELAVALKKPGSAVRAAVALLYACGLIEDGDDDGALAPAVGVPAELAAFLGRQLDTTRANRNLATALHRLATSRVVVVGTESVDVLGRSLRRSGIEYVRTAVGVDWQGVLDSALTDGIDLVVGLATEAIPFDEVDRWCATAGVPWLRSAHTSAGIEIGPRFEDPHTSCHRCLTLERAATLTVPGSRRHAAWLGLVVDEAVALLSRVGAARSGTGLTVVDLDGWQERVLPVPRRPGCPRCCPGPADAAADPPLALRYEQAVALPPRHLLNPKDHQQHYRPANLALQAVSKRYPAAPHVDLISDDQAPLPSGNFLDGLARRAGPATDVVDLAVLAGLLPRVAGLRPTAGQAAPAVGKVQRWAPTGGNLGSAQLYLLAVAVAGLTPGWYFYDPAQHRLASVRRCADAGADLVGRIVRDGSTTVPAGLIVLTGALGRVSRKYFDFGYRIVHLDAGVAIAQLQAVSAGYGLVTRVAHRWDDRLVHEQLRLDAFDEPVTAVVSLYGEDSDDRRS